MKIEKLPSGSLIIRENWPLLRATCVIGLLLLSLTLFFAASVDGSFDWTKIAGAGLGVIVLCSIGAVVDDRRFVFDPSLETLTWEQRNWFRSRGGRLPFSEIQDVVVVLSRERDPDSIRTRDSYTTVLVTSAGRIALTGTAGGNRREYDDLADAVLAVLSRSRDAPTREPEIERLIAAGRMIDAIALIREQKGLGLMEAKTLADEIKRNQAER